MIGKACVSVFKYYDVRTQQMSFKKRPVLIIGQADETDFVALPISRVSKKEFLDPVYDVPISPENFPAMNLKQVSYIRAHKQAVISRTEITYDIADFKRLYPDKFCEILDKVSDFQEKMIRISR